MKNIEVLIANGGSISLDAQDEHECVAAASDAHNCLTLLVWRKGESLPALLKRLDKAIALANDEGVFTDEVNDSIS